MKLVSMRGARLRAGKFGVVVGVASLFVGCDNGDTVADNGDADADAAVGFISAETRGRADGGTTSPHDTQDLSVRYDTDATKDHLSVGLDRDAGVTTVETSEAVPTVVETSVPPVVSSSADFETPAATSTSDEQTTVDVDTTSAPAATTEDVDTTPAPAATTEDVDTTSVPAATTENVDTTSVPAATTEDVDTTSAPAATTENVDPTSAPAATTEDVDTTSTPTATTEDVDTTSAPASSSGNDSSSAGETIGPLPPLEASIATAATWVDLPATLSATLPNVTDVPLELEWSVVSVPSGSRVANEGLQGLTESTVTFVPDVAGTYTLNLHLAAGGQVGDVEASVTVAHVDVGLLRVDSWIDGAYSYEPLMVPSDASSDPFNVGCSYNSWEFRDFWFWRYSLQDVTRSIGFRYSKDAGDPTLFAYAHQRDIDAWATHVATAKSDCESNRPVDLELGHVPTFSPSSKQLARIRYTDGTFLLASSIDNNDVVYPTAANPQTCEWLDETSIVWNGNITDGNFDGPGVGLSSTLRRGWTTILNCAARGALFDWIDRVAVVDGGLLVLAYEQLWFLPTRIDANGNLFAVCDAEADGNILIAWNVADFEVAPDRRSLALITHQWYGDVPYVYLGIGPVDVPFEPETASWRAFEIGNPFSYYTGLHWIANAQQLVWTAVDYSTDIGGNYQYTPIHGSAIHKINADGSAPRVLASRGVREGEDDGVITTGPINLPYEAYVGGVD